MRDIRGRGCGVAGKGGCVGGREGAVQGVGGGAAGRVGRRVPEDDQSLPEFLISLASTLIFTVAKTALHGVKRHNNPYYHPFFMNLATTYGNTRCSDRIGRWTARFGRDSRLLTQRNRAPKGEGARALATLGRTRRYKQLLESEGVSRCSFYSHFL